MAIQTDASLADDIGDLTLSVHRLNQQIASFVERHPDIRLTGRVNYRTDEDVYLEVRLDLTQVIATLS